MSFRDVTAQRTLERQKDDFLSAVAHDLKTPLTTIKGLSQILGRRAARANTPETRALLEGLNRIDVTTTRMSGLINELLDVSRIQMGRSLDLIRTSVDLVDLIQHIANEQQHTTELHTVRVTAPETEVRGGGMRFGWSARSRIWCQTQLRIVRLEGPCRSRSRWIAPTNRWR